MLKITVRGEANAQALFDVLNGQGVTWSEPYTPPGAYTETRGAHTLTVQRPSQGLAEHLHNLFPDMKFTTKEF